MRWQRRLKIKMHDRNGHVFKLSNEHADGGAPLFLCQCGAAWAPIKDWPRKLTSRDTFVPYRAR